eukprot:9053456-Ditylum_brightwellii.AAC.1
MEKDKKTGEKRKLEVGTGNEESRKKMMVKETISVKEQMQQGMEKFEIRNALLKILNRLHLADPKMYVKYGDKTWRDDKDFPSGEKIKEMFSINKVNPPRGKLMM